MKKFYGTIAGVVILLLLCSGVFDDIVKFFAWLFTLQYSQPDTSIAGGIIVRILTFAVSYGLVGLFFNTLGWFDSKTMSIAYFIISTLIGFALAYIVWTIEKYIVVIGIVLGILIIGFVTLYIVESVSRNKKRVA